MPEDRFSHNKGHMYLPLNTGQLFVPGKAMGKERSQKIFELYVLIGIFTTFFNVALCK